MDVKYSDLKNKRVFITGGGSGIGASIVEHFCKQGSEVYFVDINLKETKKLLNKLKKKKFRAPTFIECNLLDIKKLEGVIKKIISSKGPIHALINNAANDDRHTTDQVDEKYWQNRIPTLPTAPEILLPTLLIVLDANLDVFLARIFPL